MLGKQSDDLETRTDQERLSSYASSLKNNYKAVTRLDILTVAKKLYV
jgi:hypothetical protein